MLFSHGDTAELQGKEWFYLELRNDETTEVTARRLMLALPNILRDTPCEIFIPIGKRDLDVYELKTGNFLFIRSTSAKALWRLRTITGVLGLVCAGDSNKITDVIPMADSYVQSVIQECEKECQARCEGIQSGSFVRVLDGVARDFCGHVDGINGDTVTVRIEFITRRLVLKTPLLNLLNLSHVEEARRVFYYGPLIESLPAGDLHLIAGDLKFNDVFPVFEKKLPTPDRRRLNSTTEFVRKQIASGNIIPREIIRLLLEGYQNKTVNPVKSLFIAFNVMKEQLVDYFEEKDGVRLTWWQVHKKYGGEYKVSAKVMSEFSSDLPLVTPPDKLAKDGRTIRFRKANAPYQCTAGVP